MTSWCFNSKLIQRSVGNYLCTTTAHINEGEECEYYSRLSSCLAIRPFLPTCKTLPCGGGCSYCKPHLKRISSIFSPAFSVFLSRLWLPLIHSGLNKCPVYLQVPQTQNQYWSRHNLWHLSACCSLQQGDDNNEAIQQPCREVGRRCLLIGNSLSLSLCPFPSRSLLLSLTACRLGKGN